MKIGIYGGSFDPVHLGHLILAETCREQLQLDEIWWVPAKVSPFKTEQQPIEGKQRAAMLDFAVAGHPEMKVDRREIKRNTVSYTIDTLREIQQEKPDAELYLLMGADALQGLAGWKEPVAIAQLAKIVAVNRVESQPQTPPWPDGPCPKEIQSRIITLTMPNIDLSSSDLRQRIREGRSIRYLVPRPVENYIIQHKLFR